MIDAKRQNAKSKGFLLQEIMEKGQVLYE